MQSEQSEYSVFFDFIQRLIIPYVDLTASKLYANEALPAFQAFRALKSTIGPLLYPADAGELDRKTAEIGAVINAQRPGDPKGKLYKSAKAQDHARAIAMIWDAYEFTLQAAGRRGIWERHGTSFLHATLS